MMLCGSDGGDEDMSIILERSGVQPRYIEPVEAQNKSQNEFFLSKNYPKIQGYL